MALYQTLEIALTSQKLFISIKFAFFHLNAKRRGLDIKRFLTQWTMPILIGALICGQAVFCTGRGDSTDRSAISQQRQTSRADLR